jgi:hypothetical protein
MKLIFCPDCQDVVRLFSEPRKCKCGKVSGKYIDDVDIAIKGKAMVLCIHNNDVAEALDFFQRGNAFSSIRCWSLSPRHPKVVRS